VTLRTQSAGNKQNGSQKYCSIKQVTSSKPQEESPDYTALPDFRSYAAHASKARLGGTKSELLSTLVHLNNTLTPESARMAVFRIAH
jgi:hypothetical protein